MSLKIVFTLFHLCLIVCSNEPDPVAVRLLQLQVAKLKVMVADLETSIASENDFCPCNETVNNLTLSLQEVEEEILNASSEASAEVKYLKGQMTAKYEGCQQLYRDNFTASGMYQIWLVDQFDFFPMYCDMDAGDNRGWMTFQRRYNGMRNFSRPVKEYESGFGSPKEEHWVGLNNLYTLSRDSYSSRSDRARLRVDMEDTDGVKAYAEYEYFSISAKSEGYKLKVLSGYTGTSGDGLSAYVNNTFRVCDGMGGWWVQDCSDDLSLNGHFSTLYWPTWNLVNPGNVTLRTVSMKVQRYKP